MNKTVKISRDFSRFPGARYYTDGPFSGEMFRKEIIESLFEKNYDLITIDLDGTAGYATSFLEETFGGLVRRYGIEKVKDKIKIKSEEDPTLIDDIMEYMQDALL